MGEKTENLITDPHSNSVAEIEINVTKIQKEIDKQKQLDKNNSRKQGSKTTNKGVM